MTIRALTVPLLLCLLAAPASAWHDEGHIYAARAAAQSLPEDVPAFFRDGGATIAHVSLDPDVVRSRDLPQIRAATAPDHYLDIEMLRGREWPRDRYAYIELCRELGIDPDKAGTLPWAIAERAQWLTMAFAEHRRYPDNPHIRAKILVIAGDLSHYTADLHMPLHTTVHFDGRVPQRADGSYDFGAPRQNRGLHARVDALPTKIPYDTTFAEPLPPAEAHAELLPLIRREFDASHALVDRTYELAPGIPEVADLTLEDEEVRAFTIDRARASAKFTADVFLSAWRNSADIELPDWLDRRVFDETFDPSRVPPQPGQ